MTRARTRWVIALGGLALVGGVAAVACVHTRAPRARLGPAAVARLEAFPYRDFEALLRERVDDQGRVDYGALRAHREPLDRFLAAVAEAGPTRRPDLFPRREDRLAYYLNAYNALTLRNVIEEWPFREINDLRKLRFFVTTRYVVDGRETSLKSLEDDVVRGRFHDPRVHAALNCGARGCPRLPREAFWPDRLDAQLDREMRAFVSEPRSVRVDPDGRRVWLSQIFDWFEDDFVQAERDRGVARPSVITYVNRHRAPDAQIPTGLAVEHIPYDWTVNAQRLPDE